MATKVRSAIDGRYKTKAYGARNPDTTVTETDRPKGKPKGGGGGKKKR